MHAVWIVHSCIRWRWTTVVAFVCNEWKWKNSRLEFEITTNIRSLFFYAKQFVPFFSSRGDEGINVVHTFSCMRECVFHMWILANFMAFCCWFVTSIAWLSIFSSMWFNTFWNRFFFIFVARLFHFTTFHRMIAFFLLECAKAAFNEKVSYYYAPSSSTTWYRDLLL